MSSDLGKILVDICHTAIWLGLASTAVVVQVSGNAGAETLCNPKDNNARILTAPAPNALDPRWGANDHIGTGWSLSLSREVQGPTGLFAQGDLYTSRGNLTQKDVFILLSEWECSNVDADPQAGEVQQQPAAESDGGSGGRQPLVLSHRGLGPLAPGMRFDPATIRADFPGYDVKTESISAEGMPLEQATLFKDGRKTVEVVGDGGRITNIMVFAPGILDEQGIGVGTKFGDIQKSALTSCIFGEEETGGIVLCSAAASGQLQYWFENHNLNSTQVANGDILEQLAPNVEVSALRLMEALPHDQ